MRRLHTYLSGTRTAALAALLVLISGATGCQSNHRAMEMEAAAAKRSTLVGKNAPDFTLLNQDARPVHLAGLRGEWVVLYFYPKNGTPGCTCQAREFARNYSRFDNLNAEVYGISPDSVESHQETLNRLRISVNLLADPRRTVMREYGAWVDTPTGGRAVRSTVLIDPDGNIAYHWPEVIPEGHAARVEQELREIQERQQRQV